MRFGRKPAPTGPGSVVVHGDNHAAISTSVTIGAQRGEPAWPCRVGLVPRLADCFQPRETGDRSAVLTGLGGVGKTQLAAGIAEQLWAANRVDLLVWVPATSRQAIVDRYAQAAADLALPGADGTDTEQDAGRFLAWLAGSGRPWLVVLDDLTEAADLKGLWPPERPHGRTVITTRLRGAALTGGGCRLVPVETFTAAEAAAFVHARLAAVAQLDDDAGGVAADLGMLPLALSQATAFMIDEEVPCSEYRRRFADRRRVLDDLVPEPAELPEDYSRTVAATLSLSVEAADRARPAGMGSVLLRVAAVLDPAGIPAALFTTSPARNWIAYARGQDTPQPPDVDAVRSGLRVLHRLNLVTAADGVVSVHALVQRVVRDPLSDEDLAEVAWAAADALLEIWPEVERDTALAQRLRSNAGTVSRHGGDELLGPETHPILRRAVLSRGRAGDPAGA
ncbi:ATP-binding protein, partial [Actinoplanes sp. NPDC024001]|uniref:ATP-binding protein n=1 Tax=Actinoplanes sp. NPDC024001 TaxID=3154598 RepID=UPI0033F4B017